MAVMHYRCADVEIDRFAMVSAKLEELVKEMRALIDGQEFARLALTDRGRVTDMFMEAVVRKKAIDTVITYRVPLSRVREAANWSDRGQSFDENMLLTKFFDEDKVIEIKNPMDTWMCRECRRLQSTEWASPLRCTSCESTQLCDLCVHRHQTLCPRDPAKFTSEEETRAWEVHRSKRSMTPEMVDNQDFIQVSWAVKAQMQFLAQAERCWQLWA